MSWLDQVNNDFIIVTGDKKKYSPNWFNATRDVEYNVSQYEFPEVKGTLAVRRKPKGTKYNLEIFFQGEDHLVVAEKFRISAEDSRSWKIIHPFYGTMIVQPLSLSFNNAKYNVSEIKGIIIETSVIRSPKITVAPQDKIIQDKAKVDEVMAQAFVVNVPEVKTDAIADLTSNVTGLYTEGKKIISDNIDAEQYINLFNSANTAILNITSEPLLAIRSVQALASYPSQFAANVKNRIETLGNQFTSLSDSISAVFSPAQKKVYENNAGAVLSTMMLASVTNADYENNSDVLAIMQDIIDAYDQYILDLDELQTTTGGDPESFAADSSSIIELNSLLNFTVSNLFDIALDSKKEMSILCEEDTNAILLAHRFYGLQVDDSTIDKIIANNNIGLNDLFQIRKGTKIIYYI